MTRKPLMLWGAALMSAVIGFHVAIGEDSLPRAEKRDISTAEKGVSKAAAALDAKLAEKADPKPIAKVAEKKPADQPISADEKAIRLTGETFVKAYCEADAKSVAAHFTPDAEYIDERGNVYQGRDAIQGAMKSLFADNPGCELEMDIDTIRFISPGVAVEDGTTSFVPSSDSETIESHYIAIHVKVDGKWLTASVREHAPKDRRQHRAQLGQLEWLNGEWVDEGEDSIVIFSCKSVDGGNFLLRKFVVQVAGQEAMSGTQRIGWDPLAGKFRTWIFDSEGGYSDGFWHRDGDRWLLKSTGVTSDGQTASGTTIYTIVNEDSMTWQSIDREIAGVAVPDSEPITIVRRLPDPEIIIEVSESK